MYLLLYFFLPVSPSAVCPFVCLTLFNLCRCRRPKSQQPSVVLMWDKLLMVAGVCNDVIQYPLKQFRPDLGFSWTESDLVLPKRYVASPEALSTSTPFGYPRVLWDWTLKTLIWNVILIPGNV